MKTPARVLILLGVTAAAAGTVFLKERTATPPALAAVSTAAGKLPHSSISADKCVPCKLMAPILEELKKEYAGKIDVEFIDVWKDPDAGKNTVSK